MPKQKHCLLAIQAFRATTSYRQLQNNGTQSSESIARMHLLFPKFYCFKLSDISNSITRQHTPGIGECIVMHLKKTSLQLHTNNFGLKQLSTIVKEFHY